MSSFVITADRPGTPNNEDDIRHIRIAAGDDVLTRLVRNGHENDEALRAPATPLAFWLVDNWWRIRCEPVPFTGTDWQWRMAHELTAIGAGYIWPRVAFWGEGARVGISVDERVLPTWIQFLADGIRYLPADEVESGVDRFIRQMLSEPIVDRAALQTEYDALCAEREDQGARDWRTVEAMLGYDIDEAPDGLMDTLDGVVDQYGQTGIEEAVLARPGEQAADALQTAVEAARTSNIRAYVPAPLKEVALDREQPIAPWALAEQAAASVRAELCLTGPVGNQALADILGVSCNAIEDKAAPGLPYGLRLTNGDGKHSRIALKTTRPQARRFELCRHLGDMVWSDDSQLCPVSDALSVRQKFQRAFAQNFLCPYSELTAYCGTEPAPDDIAAAAAHFDVSERDIETTLARNGNLETDSFIEQVRAA